MPGLLALQQTDFEGGEGGEREVRWGGGKGGRLGHAGRVATFGA